MSKDLEHRIRRHLPQTYHNSLELHRRLSRAQGLRRHGNSLFPNQFVNIQLVVDDLQNQVVMPNAAVHRGAPNGVTTTFVYFVNPDSTVSVRPVTLGVVDGENVGVTAGLTPGAVVVTEGGDRLRDGAPVSLPGAAPAIARTANAAGATPAAGAQHAHNGKGRRNRQNAGQPSGQAGQQPPQ